jgi:hypothetical protein
VRIEGLDGIFSNNDNNNNNTINYYFKLSVCHNLLQGWPGIITDPCSNCENINDTVNFCCGTADNLQYEFYGYNSKVIRGEFVIDSVNKIFSTINCSINKNNFARGNINELWTLDSVIKISLINIPYVKNSSNEFIANIKGDDIFKYLTALNYKVNDYFQRTSTESRLIYRELKSIIQPAPYAVLTIILRP